MTPTHEPSKRPLSDAEFDALDYVVISDARKIQADARYHRARVRELERERDHLRGMVDECEAALLECKHEDEELSELQRQVGVHVSSFHRAQTEVTDLRRQVDAARTALEGFADLDQVSPMYGGIAARARAALAGTEGGSPE